MNHSLFRNIVFGLFMSSFGTVAQAAAPLGLGANLYFGSASIQNDLNQANTSCVRNLVEQTLRSQIEIRQSSVEKIEVSFLPIRPNGPRDLLSAAVQFSGGPMIEYQTAASILFNRSADNKTLYCSWDDDVTFENKEMLAAKITVHNVNEEGKDLALLSATGSGPLNCAAQLIDTVVKKLVTGDSSLQQVRTSISQPKEIAIENDLKHTRYYPWKFSSLYRLSGNLVHSGVKRKIAADEISIQFENSFQDDKIHPTTTCKFTPDSTFGLFISGFGVNSPEMPLVYFIF